MAKCLWMISINIDRVPFSTCVLDTRVSLVSTRSINACLCVFFVFIYLTNKPRCMEISRFFSFSTCNNPAFMQMFFFGVEWISKSVIYCSCCAIKRRYICNTKIEHKTHTLQSYARIFRCAYSWNVIAFHLFAFIFDEQQWTISILHSLPAFAICRCVSSVLSVKFNKV